MAKKRKRQKKKYNGFVYVLFLVFCGMILLKPYIDPSNSIDTSKLEVILGEFFEEYFPAVDMAVQENLPKEESPISLNEDSVSVQVQNSSSTVQPQESVQAQTSSSAVQPQASEATVAVSPEPRGITSLTTKLPEQIEAIDWNQIPLTCPEPYVAVNGNFPFFLAGNMTTSSYEYYSELDHLGRCAAAIACVGRDLMPTEERGSISHVKPSGWQTIKYDCVDGKYLYNRCHLIGFQLTAENANEKNLITGTRYLNVIGMLPFENMVADYVKETENHVLYRVTPVFHGEELVAHGVLMEGYSVEDDGEGICFCVYVYNKQPGVVIDYATGNSWLENN